MAEKLTPQQLEAVENRDGKLLVSAAAGSGKTKVLVDRLLSYIVDPILLANVDDFLIITYTKAAAAELRGKIAAKITEKIAEDPGNRHLQLQMQRVYLAKISTVHSFCGDLLREYAYQMDIPADFRVTDENESVQLQAYLLKQLLDEAYEASQNDADFCAFVDSQGFGRDDRQLADIILKVYNSAMCHLKPSAWLDRCINFTCDAGVKDVGETVWGRYLLDDLRSYLDLHIGALERCAKLACIADGMENVVILLNQTIDQLITLQSSKTWDDVHKNSKVDYGRLTFSKKCTDLQLADQIKAVRDACKKGVASKLKKFAGTSDELLSNLSESQSAARGLISLVKKFKDRYKKLKRSRHILDFSDLEQLTLDILVGKARSGVTQLAEEIGQRFREVMVDEYQDSNAVQDAIFAALTARRQNCFLVGDVKQSIYQFRLADPGIFLEKYNSFLPVDLAKPGQGRKVLLSNNFRSSGGVIEAVNDVFTSCMSAEVGGIEYRDEELLVEGLKHIPLSEPEVVFCGIDVEEDTYAEEAAVVAEQIAELLNGTHMVREGESLRPITPDDIVILLRSPGSVGADFQFALEQRGIRCTAGAGADLLRSEEIEVLKSLLQVISNPLQDIPLVAVLTSRLFCFTADDMAAIRSRQKSGCIYDALLLNTSEKTTGFLAVLKELRRDAQLNSLSGLLNQIFAKTRIDSVYASLPDGDVRRENLQAFCQIAASCESVTGNGLSQFLEQISIMEEHGLSVQSEQKSGGSVTIMSIHKSKGLEFPVVFLCCLSRDFNRENTRAQVLCDKELGLGLTCVDAVNRVRYPSMIKRAIAAKMTAESLSEEMRVLYVAMTRARDRLFMTYAAKNIQEEFSKLLLRMKMSDMRLLSKDADCPGAWVLQAALKEDRKWNLNITKASSAIAVSSEAECSEPTIPMDVEAQLQSALAFQYPYLSATVAPSKQTATQLKGRDKDQETAEDVQINLKPASIWRKPTFIERYISGKNYGTVLHTVMQRIDYGQCTTRQSVKKELARLVVEKYITSEQASAVNCDQIVAFFATPEGKCVLSCKEVLREFKFSVLVDANKYCSDVHDEKILLQGVVDCAMIEPDGITIIDFKSDCVAEDKLPATVKKYEGQIKTYAEALAKVYSLPVKSAKLYFFTLNRFVELM